MWYKLYVNTKVVSIFFLWNMAILFIFETAGLMPVITFPTWEFVLTLLNLYGFPFFVLFVIVPLQGQSFSLKFCNSIAYFESHPPPTMEKTAADIVTKHQPHLFFVCLKEPNWILNTEVQIFNMIDPLVLLKGKSLRYICLLLCATLSLRKGT